MTERVFTRGTLPCHWLFVGEAPGRQEDLVGEPFVGDSGQLLNKIIQEAKLDRLLISYAFTNTIVCAPWVVKDVAMRAPTKQEKDNCSSRLDVFIREIAQPLQIIAVGKESEYSLKKLGYEYFKIPHPAFMLRKGGANSVDYSRTVLRLKQLAFDFNEKCIPPFLRHKPC